MSGSPDDLYLIKGAGTDVQFRHEIGDLMANPKQFNLFVLAWNKIREPDYKKPAARYQEQAGIHGMPYQRWLGDPNANADGGNYGYCNHGSILFPTWHRPAIMLIEQAIWEAAQEIAQDYAEEYPSERDEWLEAANKLRFPYWDWTDPKKHGSKFPEIFQQKRVKVQPNRGTKEVDNPLYTYKFDESLLKAFRDFDKRERIGDVIVQEFVPNAQQWPEFISHYGKWKQTYRWPTHDENEGLLDPTEQYDKLDNILKPDDPKPHQQGSLQELHHQVSSLFQYPAHLEGDSTVYAWDAFSNHNPQSQPTEEVWNQLSDEEIPDTPYWKAAKALRRWGSIEQVHDTIHVVVGGIGHMTDADYASFDPVFFLHHCNVDRIFALWEQAYPNYFMRKGGYKDQDGKEQQFKQYNGKFGWKDHVDPNDNRKVVSDINLDDETPLEPFRRDNGSYWTSRDARWKSDVPKNYTYEPVDFRQDIIDPSGTVELSARLTLASDHESVRDKVAENQLFEVVGKDAPTLKKVNARGCLQKLFGFNPVAARQAAYTKLGTSKLLYPPNGERPSPGHEQIYDYRQFILKVHVDPYIFGRSYMVRITFNALDATGQNAIDGYIGSASVFSRSNNTKCGACQGNREAGIKSTYTIPIPHSIITDIALHSGEMHVIEVLKKSLSADITLPGDFKIASTNPTTTDAQAVPEKYIPEITLHSAALQTLPDGIPHDLTGPQNYSPFNAYETYDWKNHGALFQAQNWAKVHVVA